MVRLFRNLDDGDYASASHNSDQLWPQGKLQDDEALCNLCNRITGPAHHSGCDRANDPRCAWYDDRKQNTIVPWSITDLWNASFDALPPRENKPRSYVYASELGTSFYDLYLRLIGTAPTNPPTLRSRRKFEAGNLYEWALRFVLLRAGLLKATQERVRVELPGCLVVSGKLDFRAGGIMDFTQAEKEIADMNLPQFFDVACKRIMAHFKAQYEGVSLAEYILECKSVSTFVYERNERAGKGNPDHSLQLYHYVLGKNWEAGGKVCYISKDDCRLAEYEVSLEDGDLACAYREYLEKITNYYNAKEHPPKEPMIIFEEAACSFRRNWRVEYSQYLGHYGYETPDDFRNQWMPLVARINQTYKRCVNGEKITANNVSVIKEAKLHFPNWMELIEKGKARGILIDEEEEIIQ